MTKINGSEVENPVGAAHVPGMEKNEKHFPTAKEKPEIYDGYDFRAGEPVFSQEYLNAVLPDHLKAPAES